MPKTLKNYIRIPLQKWVLNRRGVKISNNCFFTNIKFLGTATIDPYCRMIGDPLITFGENFYMNAGCHILGQITFGKDVMIGPKTVIWGRNHGIATGTPMRLQKPTRSPITIGDDVWIGANVTIVKGITIGSGAVIGAGSVVTKDIDPNVIAVGNPARVIRSRESV